MIRTLSTTLSNISLTSNESAISLPSSRTRRFTLHSLATRLSDSKNTFLEQIPHPQQQLSRFRRRAKSFISSTLLDHPRDINLSSSNEQIVSPGVYKSRKKKVSKI